MKSYYCFIRSFGNMCVGSFIYHVACGRSQREQIKLALVREYCKDCGIYFRKWDYLVDIAIENASVQFNHVKDYRGKPFIHAYVSVNELYSLIIDDSFSVYESNYRPSTSELWCSFRNLPTFIQHLNKKSSITARQPQGRKYLSGRRKADTLFVAKAFCFILGIYVGLVCFTQVVVKLFGAV